MDSQPTPDDWKTFSVLLETFASGKDRTMAVARQIEGQIATRFPSDHAIQGLADALLSTDLGEEISFFPR